MWLNNYLSIGKQFKLFAINRNSTRLVPLTNLSDFSHSIIAVDCFCSSWTLTTDCYKCENRHWTINFFAVYVVFLCFSQTAVCNMYKYVQFSIDDWSIGFTFRHFFRSRWIGEHLCYGETKTMKLMFIGNKVHLHYILLKRPLF